MSSIADLLGRFVWHDLMTTDVEAATSFYTALFPDWRINIVPMEGGYDYHMIGAGGTNVGGMLLLDEALGFPSHWISYVAVEDCDATVARLEQLGGACVLPTMEIASVGRFAIVRDAQGAHFKLFQMEFAQELPARPAIGQFCWDELLTSDIQAARAMYSELLGWESAEVEMPGLGTYTLFKNDGTDFAGGMSLPPDSDAPSNWLPYLTVDDTDARAAHVAELGGTTYVEPRDIGGVGRFSVHADPTGAAFAILQPLEK